MPWRWLWHWQTRTCRRNTGKQSETWGLGWLHRGICSWGCMAPQISAHICTRGANVSVQSLVNLTNGMKSSTGVERTWYLLCPISWVLPLHFSITYLDRKNRVSNKGSLCFWSWVPGGRAGELLSRFSSVFICLVLSFLAVWVKPRNPSSWNQLNLQAWKQNSFSESCMAWEITMCLVGSMIN